VYLDEAEQQTPLRYVLEDRLSIEPPEETSLIVYRIVQEALTNVRKHARAQVARVTLEDRDGGVLARVTDDGIGFSVETVTPAPGHLGLTAIRERAELGGGWLRITSLSKAGTTVEFWIPTLSSPAASHQGAEEATRGESEKS
jgi:signal transduction histidine kinase